MTLFETAYPLPLYPTSAGGQLHLIVPIGACDGEFPFAARESGQEGTLASKGSPHSLHGAT